MPSRLDWLSAWQRRGKVSTRFHQDIEEDDHEAPRALDTLALLHNTLRLRDLRLLVAVDVEARHENFDCDTDSGDPTLCLRNAYVETRRPRWSLSVGQQTFTWGKLDDIVILDRLSPQDLRWFAMVDKQERKEPTFAVRADAVLGRYQIEGVALPWFEPSTVDFFGTDWALFGQLKDIIQEGDYPPEVKGVVEAIDIRHDAPAAPLQFGARLRGRAWDIDHAFTYLCLYNRFPGLEERTETGALTKRFLYEPTEENLSALVAARPSPDDLVLDTAYDRLHVLGMEFETVAGEHGIRGECAFLSDLPYMLETDFSAVRRDMFSAGIGIDRTTDWELYWNLQVVADYVFDADDLWETDPLSYQVAVNAQKDFLLGDLGLDFGSAYRIPTGDWLAHLEATYKFTGEWEVTLGLWLFEGKTATLIGRYDAKDVVTAEATWRF
jgi:hypothetical protein